MFFDFTEAVDETRLSRSSFLLIYGGPDNRLDTVDDSVVTGGLLSYQASINAAVLAFSSPLPYGVYRATISSNITDLAGNRSITSVSSIFYVLPGGREGDPDNDDLTNAEEVRRGTQPFLADTDGDGWLDGVEVADGKDPLDATSHPSFTMVAAPPVELALPGPEEPDLLGFGTFLAQPPVEVSLPVAEEPETISPGTFVGSPPVDISWPEGEEPDQPGLGTFLASPPIEVILPGPEEAEADTPGTFLALPPLDIFYR